MPLHLHTLPQMPDECCAILRRCGRHTQRKGRYKKGRRHNNRLYHQTSILLSLVIQTASTTGPNVFTQRDSHTFSCQILQSWLPLKMKKAWCFKRCSVLTNLMRNACRTYGEEWQCVHVSNACQNIDWEKNIFCSPDEGFSRKISWRRS